MVYAVRLDRELSKEEIFLFLSLTDEERRGKIRKQGISQRAMEGLVGDVLTRFAIKKEFGINLKNISFSRNDYGKPYLENFCGIHFNVSHSKEMVVCAVGKTPVGTDVEKIKSVKYDVKERVCTKDELEQIKDSDEEFIKLWTQKEAVVKKYGTGIAKGDFKNCLTNENVTSVKLRNYIISLSY